MFHGQITDLPSTVKREDGEISPIMDTGTGRGIGKRLELAILLYRSRVGPKVNQAEIARLIGEAEEGRGRGYSGSTLTEGVQERKEPRRATLEAMGAVLRGDPGRYRSEERRVGKRGRFRWSAEH